MGIVFKSVSVRWKVTRERHSSRDKIRRNGTSRVPLLSLDVIVDLLFVLVSGDRNSRLLRLRPVIPLSRPNLVRKTSTVHLFSGIYLHPKPSDVHSFSTGPTSS